MNGPLLLLRATLYFVTIGFTLWTKLFGARRGKLLFFGAMGASTVVAIYLQMTR